MIDIEELAKEYGLTEFVYGTEYVSDSLVNFAEAYAAKVLEDKEREIAELKTTVRSDNSKVIAALNAHINDLRAALESLIKHETPNWSDEFAWKIYRATPAQSLQEHDNEVIEKCAEIVWFYEWIGKEASEAIVSKIRALKG